MKNINFRGRKGRLNREGGLINFLPREGGGGGLLEGEGLFERGSLIEDLRYVVACQNLIITVPHFNFISLIFFSTNQLTWVYHSLVKNINFRGGKRRLNREGGAYQLSSPEKGGGSLLEGECLFERGSLIEDLRYVAACQNLIITVPHFNFISLIFFSTNQLTWFSCGADQSHLSQR